MLSNCVARLFFLALLALVIVVGTFSMLAFVFVLLLAVGGVV